MIHDIPHGKIGKTVKNLGDCDDRSRHSGVYMEYKCIIHDQKCTDRQIYKVGRIITGAVSKTFDKR